MDTVWELFTHGMRDMLNCEEQLMRVLAEAESESTDEMLREAFGEHRKQTANHAMRLTTIFRELGETPEQGDCKGIQGLTEEKKNILKERPAKELLDFINVNSGIKAERYEMSAYEGLMLLARELGALNAAKLLKENYDEEQETLDKLRGFINKVKPEKLGVSTNKPEGGIPRKIA
jgi:ferritin-like metal-binding protein YciE